jgi:hypothetical protein
MQEFLIYLGIGSAYALIGLACLAGVFLSALSFSGTWLVLLATLGAAFLRGAAFPGWKTVALFAVISALVEVADTMAGAWGVKRRGGSGWASLAALVGGIAGMVAGSAVMPVFGSIIGMFAGCFGGAFAVEYLRLAETERYQASHIARGALLARVLIICLKLGVTLAMVISLFAGILLID